MHLKQWMDKLESLDPSRIEMGLSRTTKVLKAMDLHRPKVPVISLAGTNGKGSSAAFLESIYRAAGYKTATTTSPHLLSVNERIRINNQPIDDETFTACLAAVEAGREDTPLTYFEFIIVAALYCFRQSEVDVIILEVGLGGRLDAVNCIDSDVAIVTSIGLDHEAWLGTDLEQIAREKAAICRPQRPLILANDTIPQSADVLAREHQSQVLRAGQDYSFKQLGDRWTLSYQGESVDYVLPSLASVPLSNLAAALIAVTELQSQLPVSIKSINQGVTEAKLAGRGQQITLNWQGVDCQITLDVAHNRDSAIVLARNVNGLNSKPIALCAMLIDKECELVVEQLSNLFSSWHFAGLSGPRGQSAESLHARTRVIAAQRHQSVTMAMPQVLNEAIKADTPHIIIFGSFETVGEAMKWIQEHGASFSV